MIADLVVTGVALWTGPGEVAGAFAVRDGVFVYVGDAAGAAGITAAHAEDWGGAFAMPGFVDAHAHPMEGGVELAECGLSEATTGDDVLRAVDACAAPGGRGWLVGNGWALTAFPDANPTAAALDGVVGDRPTFLLAADGHSAWLSSAGLARLRIDAQTPDPPGGRIERGADGAPSGVLREAAVDPAWDVLPAPSNRELREGALRAQDRFLAAGVTTVLEANTDVPMLRAWRSLARRGELHLRVAVALSTDPAEGADQIPRLARLRRRFERDGLRVGAVKLFVDGVLESRTAATLAPYVDTGTTVPIDWAPAALRETVAAAWAAGLDVHAHTIGDAAVRAVLDAAQAAPAPRGQLALAHVEVVDPADVPRFAALGVVPVFSPLWAYPDPYVVDLTLPGVSPEVGARLYPIGELERAGAALAFGSDWSVSSLVPLEGIEVAVTRRDPDDPDGDVLGVDQALDVEAALVAYTAGAGQVAGLGTGAARVGAPADVLRLSEDPRAAPDLSAIRVVTVLVGGVAP